MCIMPSRFRGEFNSTFRALVCSTEIVHWILSNSMRGKMYFRVRLVRFFNMKNFGIGRNETHFRKKQIKFYTIYIGTIPDDEICFFCLQNVILHACTFPKHPKLWKMKLWPWRTTKSVFVQYHPGLGDLNVRPMHSRFWSEFNSTFRAPICSPENSGI